MSRNATKDLTTGSPMKLILGFGIPLLFGMLFQQFYNMMDTIIVGKFLGVSALASVGATGSINFMIIGFCMGVCNGFAIPVAQRFGAKDEHGMRKFVANSVWLSIIFAVVMAVLVCVFCRQILELMNTPEDIFDDAYTYIMIICGGIFTQVLYNLLSSILRALGNSKLPLLFLVISALLNIVLDLVFIVGFGMGAKGAAVATVIAQGISGVLCLVYIIRKVPILRLTKEDWKLDGTLVKIQFGIGFPMAFQYSITAIGAMMMQSSLNILGSVAIAGFTAASKIEQLVTQAYVALGTTMATYCAQNMGAGKILRIRQGFKSATWMGFAYAVVTGIFVMFAGKYLTPLFLSENLGQIMGYVDIYLKCVGLFFIPLTVVNVYRNGIQGMGFGILPMMAGVAELIGRGVVAIGAAHYKSYVGVCLASPAAWVLAGGLLLVMYFHIMKRYTEDLSGQK